MAHRPAPLAALRTNENPSRTKKQQSSSLDKCSITSPILKHDIGENTVTENFLCSGCEIRVLHRLFPFLIFRHNPSNKAVAVPEFNCLASAQPSLQTSRVSELADIHGGHGVIVTHECATIKSQQALPRNGVIVCKKGPHWTRGSP